MDTIADISTELQSSKDYSWKLQDFGATCVADGYYWRVGEIKQVQGWILHLSAIRCQIEIMVDKVVPYLLKVGIPFKLVRDIYNASYLSSGTVGYANVGKVLCLYPEDRLDLDVLVQDLIYLTKDIKGPAVPTDQFLDAAVYIGYGAHAGIAGRDMYGEVVHLIYDKNGNLCPDPLTIPFKKPAGIEWPLVSIKDLSTEQPKRILHNRYYPISVIKPDVKGRVLKAIYFQSVFKIKTALIKEGKRGMCDDMNGRDIIDRLKWQCCLHEALQSEVPIPRIFDQFEQDGNFYLAMDFVKGISLHELKALVFQKRAWADLPAKGKLRLIDQFLHFLDIVAKIHSLGYLHRDINPGNVLIDPKDRMWLIDMELAWSIADQYPMPAFGTGTQGFMSPEQEADALPDISQDIYSLGAFALDMFTNIHPIKFPMHTQKVLSASIDSFVDNPAIANTITACLAADPIKRPNISTLKASTMSFRNTILGNKDGAVKTKPISIDQLKKVVQKGLLGLKTSAMHDPSYGWFSLNQQQQSHIGNPQVEVNIYPGWSGGNAGILWLLARAKRCGFDIEHLETEIQNSWKNIESTLSAGGLAGGLFHGTDGIVKLVSEPGIDSLLDTSKDISELVYKSLTTAIDYNSLENGWAGRGLAALKAAKYMTKGQYSDIISQAITNIGSIKLNNRGIPLALNSGVSGWCLFLSAVLKSSPDDVIRSIHGRLISFLIKSSKRKGEHIYWEKERQATNEFIDHEGMLSGNAGICLALIEAYKITGDAKLRQLVEQNLSMLPRRIVMNNFCLANGLAGLGEVYLEAYNTFKEPEWLERSDWIAGSMVNLQKEDIHGGGYWITDQSSIITADLFNGNAGILHFLLRRISSSSLSHPLLL